MLFAGLFIGMGIGLSVLIAAILIVERVSISNEVEP